MREVRTKISADAGKTCVKTAPGSTQPPNSTAGIAHRSAMTEYGTAVKPVRRLTAYTMILPMKKTAASAAESIQAIFSLEEACCISAAVPAFTGQMKGNVGLSSAVNSVCILCSIVFMTVLMLVML